MSIATLPAVREVRVTPRKSVVVRVEDGMVRDDTHLTTFLDPRRPVTGLRDRAEEWSGKITGGIAPSHSDEAIEAADRIIEMALVAGPEMASMVDIIDAWAYDQFGRRVLLEGQVYDGKGLRRPAPVEVPTEPKPAREPRATKPPIASEQQAIDLIRSMGYDGHITKAMIRAAKSVLRDRAKARN